MSPLSVHSMSDIPWNCFVRNSHQKAGTWYQLRPHCTATRILTQEQNEKPLFESYEPEILAGPLKNTIPALVHERGASSCVLAVSNLYSVAVNSMKAI